MNKTCSQPNTIAFQILTQFNIQYCNAASGVKHTNGSNKEPLLPQRHFTVHITAFIWTDV